MIPRIGLRVLAYLREEPGSTARDIACEFGASIATITGAIRYLLADGSVARDQSRPRPVRGGRRQWCYRVVARG